MNSLSLKINGMSCGHCVAAVTKALQTLDGVAVDNVSIGQAQVRFDPDRTSADAIARAVERQGYSATAA